MMNRLPALFLLVLLSCAGPAFAKTLVMGGYPDVLLLVDEETGTLTERVKLETGLPTSIQKSADGKFIYVATITTGGIEVFDTQAGKIVKSFSLNSPRLKYRFWGGAIGPKGRYFYTTGTRIEKEIDRYRVSRPRYLVIDLEKEEVVRSALVEPQDRRNTRRLVVSDDGASVYMFGSKMLVLDVATMKVTKRVELAEPDKPGAGEIDFGQGIERMRTPGEYVSVFNSVDPYIHNKAFGIARIDLASQQVDFEPVGQAPDRMSNLEITPDGKTGYTVVSHGRLGNRRCEFWRFDLEEKSMTGKSEFACRSRFRFGMSSGGEKLYIFAAGYEIEVFDADTFEREEVWDVQNDITGAGMVIVD